MTDKTNKKDPRTIKFYIVHSVEKVRMKFRKLIAGPSVYICEECVDLCNNIIEEELNAVNESRPGH